MMASHIFPQPSKSPKTLTCRTLSSNCVVDQVLGTVSLRIVPATIDLVRGPDQDSSQIKCAKGKSILAAPETRSIIPTKLMSNLLRNCRKAKLILATTTVDSRLETSKNLSKSRENLAKDSSKVAIIRKRCDTRIVGLICICRKKSELLRSLLFQTILSSHPRRKLTTNSCSNLNLSHPVLPIYPEPTKIIIFYCSSMVAGKVLTKDPYRRDTERLSR